MFFKISTFLITFQTKLTFHTETTIHFWLTYMCFKIIISPIGFQTKLTFHTETTMLFPDMCLEDVNVGKSFLAFSTMQGLLFRTMEVMLCSDMPP